MSNPIDTLGLSCPNGGEFYVCQNSKIQFLGCCASDPCAGGSGSCPQSDLRYSSFDADKYENVSSQACSGDGNWYTCSGLDTPFLGCCSSNACSDDDGCPTKSLVAAKLSSNTESAAVFETTSATKTATTATSASTSMSTVTGSSVSSTGTSSTTSSSSVSTPTNPSAPVNESSSSSLSKGATAGVSIAGTLLLIALAAALLFFGRRKWRERGVVVKGSEPPTPSALMSDPIHSYLYHEPNRVMHTPPPFQSPSNSQNPVLAVINKSPAHSSSRTNSVGSWLSSASRQASASSANSNKTRLSQLRAPNNSWQELAISPATSREDIEQQQHQPFIPHSQPLETVAELEGTDISRPPSELPGDTYPHRPSIYRPYRPSVGSVRDFEDIRSGLYP